MNARAIARGGIFTAVSLALLLSASILQLASYCLCILASWVPELFFQNGERRVGRMVYVATSVLSLLLLPDKMTALLYAVGFGLYTVLRDIFQRCPRRFGRWLMKLTFAYLEIFAVLALLRFGLIPDMPSLRPWMIVAVLLGGGLTFLYYELCLGRIFPSLGRLTRRFFMMK
jgi:hypothetical protein